MCSEAVVCLLESASRAEKAAEAVQQFVRRGFDVMDGPVEFAICIDLFLSQEGLKLEGKGLPNHQSTSGVYLLHHSPLANQYIN